MIRTVIINVKKKVDIKKDSNYSLKATTVNYLILHPSTVYVNESETNLMVVTLFITSTHWRYNHYGNLKKRYPSSKTNLVGTVSYIT